MTFDERVLHAIQKIPSGKVATYKQIADVLGTKAYRAVGQALKRNEHPIVIPCHRVVRSDGTIGGYDGNNPQKIKKKIYLLEKEGIVFQNGKIDLERFGWKD